MRGLTLRSALVVDAEPVLHVGAVVLDHHVGLRHALEGARPSGDLRFERHRCACCGAGSGNRARRAAAEAESPGARSGASILMTLAPQSASWRTQVGPERTRVRSSTVNLLVLGLHRIDHDADEQVEHGEGGDDDVGHEERPGIGNFSITGRTMPIDQLSSVMIWNSE
jgi:hypothetical protein